MPKRVSATDSSMEKPRKLPLCWIESERFDAVSAAPLAGSEMSALVMGGDSGAGGVRTVGSYAGRPVHVTFAAVVVAVGAETVEGLL